MVDIKGHNQTNSGLVLEVPKGWEIHHLGSMSELFVPMRDKPKKFDGDIPWLRIDDLDGKFASDSKINQRVDKETVKKMNLRIYPVGTVLCSCSATIGVCAITKRELITNQTFIGIYPKSQLDGEFLYYYLLTQASNLRKISSGTTILYISRENFEAFPIVRPSLKEQQKIASILSNIDKLIQKKEQLIEKTQGLKKALTQRLLTKGIGHSKFKKTDLGEIPEDWEIKTYNELFEFLRTGTNSRDDLKVIGDVQYIHYGDIHAKWHSVVDCDLEEIPWIDKAKVQRLPFLKEGDLIIADASEDYEGSGASILLKNVKNRKIVSGLHTIALRNIDKNVFSDYKRYLNSIKVVKNQIIAYVTGVSVYGLSKNNLKKIRIPLPPSAEQQKIAEILSNVDELIQKQKINKSKLESLKKGLMQKLLTGKIRLK